MVMGVWYSKDCTYVMLFPVYSLRVLINTVVPGKFVMTQVLIISLGTFIFIYSTPSMNYAKNIQSQLYKYIQEFRSYEPVNKIDILQKLSFMNLR